MALASKATRHKFYGTARWRRVRTQALVRDRYTCRHCGRVEASARCHGHHVKPHHGDPEKFFDVDNVVCLCQPCHDTQARQVETYGYSLEIDAETGLPCDPNHPFLCTAARF